MKLFSILTLFTLLQICKGDDSSISGKEGPCRPGTNRTMDTLNKNRAAQAYPAINGERTYCVKNEAAGYPCNKVDLESFVPVQDLDGGGNTETNDIWGWTSPDTGIEYALVGLKTGTSFVSLEDPNNPVVLGLLHTYSSNSIWRDMKTYKNFIFVVSEAFAHGMQIFNLTILDSTTQFTNFYEDVIYSEVSTAHNIAINEESGFAYIVGANGDISCNEGIHAVNITDPLNPSFAGCFSKQGYTHDVQCVIYNGTDSNYIGSEICFASNEDKVDIIDVSNKTKMELISTFTYENEAYTHQGWLTENHQYFLINDEEDERVFGAETRTIICDVSDLSNPTLKGIYTANTLASDHNMYVKGNYLYQSNYRAGLRVLDIGKISYGKMKEVAYFDVYPLNDNKEHNGDWGNYPYFDSGLIVVTSIERGLFVLRMSVIDKGKVLSWIESLFDLVKGLFGQFSVALGNLFIPQ